MASPCVLLRISGQPAVPASLPAFLSCSGSLSCLSGWHWAFYQATNTFLYSETPNGMTDVDSPSK